MIRVGFSITRLQRFDEGQAICVGHADFVTEEDAVVYDNAMRMSHDQDSYDVRTWRTEFKAPEPVDPELRSMLNIAAAAQSHG